MTGSHTRACIGARTIAGYFTRARARSRRRGNRSSDGEGADLQDHADAVEVNLANPVSGFLRTVTSWLAALETQPAQRGPVPAIVSRRPRTAPDDDACTIVRSVDANRCVPPIVRMRQRVQRDAAHALFDDAGSVADDPDRVLDAVGVAVNVCCVKDPELASEPPTSAWRPNLMSRPVRSADR
jgi:hypothetical protein